MDHEPTEKSSVRSEAIAAFLSACAGSGVGWLIWLASSNIGFAIGMAGPVAALTNSLLRKF